MSRHAGIFLAQLRSDLEEICVGTGRAGTALLRLSEGMEAVVAGQDPPVTLVDGQHFRLNTAHPVVVQLLESPLRRRSDLAFVISSMMSLLNREREEITDEDERALHARLLEFAIHQGRGSWGAVV